MDTTDLMKAAKIPDEN